MNNFGKFRPPVWWKGFQIDAPNTLDKLWKLAGNSGEVAYRGLSDPKYQLTPRVARNSSHLDNEWNMMTEFLAYARTHGQELKNRLELLALAQHHGLPTRCMDVTNAFGVALYFALASKAHPNGAVVWVLDLEAMSEVAISWYQKHHHDASDDLSCEYWIFPSLPKLSGAQVTYINRDDHINDEIDIYMAQDSERPKHPPVLVAPPHISSRMSAQDAIFLIIDPCGGHLAKQLKGIDCAHALRGIWLSPQLCKKASAHLQAIGITQRLLFPDIDNLASYLTDRYS